LIGRLLRRTVDVRDDEVASALVSFAFFFCVLSGWFVMRPIRDAVAAASGVSKLPWLFAGTLTLTLICNPLFSALVSRFPARRFIPYTFQFFALNLAVFYLLFRNVSHAEGSVADLWIGRAFFVWTSMFNFFVTSVFWCFMADVYRSEQAKRLFGFIGLGGTLGSIAGSAATALLAKHTGTPNLILVSILLLELAVATVVWFPVQHDLARDAGRAGGDATRDEVIGGSVWAGLSRVVRSPYLLGISGFLILYSLGSTILYFAQADIVGREYAGSAARTAVLAQVELAAQLLTIVVQAFFTGRVIRWLGLALTLALLPLASMIGFSALAVVPVFSTLAVFTVIRRGMNFALTNPSTETLFTVVSREDKYKAKSFIETFVYRGGDQLAAWTYAGLSALGLSLAGISLTAVPLAGVWLLLGLWLGRKQAFLAGSDEYQSSASPAAAIAIAAARKAEA
jgi:ATP:ADP antiporter, AAA family